jgi:hypothetical protein
MLIVKLLHANIGELTLENDSVPRRAHPLEALCELFSSLLCIWPRVNDHKNTIRFQIAGFIVGLITTLMFLSSMMCG